jgi:phosphate starvation-inducible PhoH-like protein
MGRQKYPAEDVKTEGRSVKLQVLVKPRNDKQSLYLDSLQDNLITFASGSAGTGKTWLAANIGLKKLLDGEVSRLVLTRPVLECDEQIGFLPGTLEEKLGPSLGPLLSSIEDHVGVAGAKALMESGKVKIAPLGLMRGSTFNNSYVILDEAQNTTITQMRMFLTRFGANCQYAVCGDLAQSDLRGVQNGLQFAVERLENNDKEIKVIRFEAKDVVRSEIVKRMLKHIGE